MTQASTVADPAFAAGRRTLSERLRRFVRGFFRSPFTVAAFVVVLGTIVAAVFPGLFSSADPTVADPVNRLKEIGTAGHLLGTDQLGRDVLARLALSARLAWLVGLSVSLGSLTVGGAIGAVSGYLGGLFDTIASRAIDGLLAFPPLLLALVFAAVFGPSTRTAVISLAIVYIPLSARVMRSVVMEERDLDYIRASRGLGHTETWTLVRHLLPNTLGPMLVVGTIVVSRAIVIEASLSFLGAGTQPPTPSWGTMIAEARDLITVQPALVLIPAIALSLTVLAINLLADAMGDYLDPGGSSGARGGAV